MTKFVGENISGDRSWNGYLPVSLGTNQTPELHPHTPEYGAAGVPRVRIWAQDWGGVPASTEGEKMGIGLVHRP